MKQREFRIFEPTDSDINEGNFMWSGIPESRVREKHKIDGILCREVNPALDLAIQRMAEELEDAKWVLNCCIGDTYSSDFLEDEAKEKIKKINKALAAYRDAKERE